MQILLWASPEPAGATVVTRLERDLAAQFGLEDVRREAEGSRPDAVVIAVRDEDVLHHRTALETTIRRAHDRAAPLLVVPLDAKALRGAGRLPPALRALADAPTLGPQEVLPALLYIVELNQQPIRSLSAPPARSRRAPGPSLVRRVRRNLARRDQVLLKIAGSSVMGGLLILTTLSAGGASLFFFVGAVTFLLSTPPEQRSKYPDALGSPPRPRSNDDRHR